MVMHAKLVICQKVEIEELLAQGGGMGGLPTFTWHTVYTAYTIMALSELARN